jgi:hypothetical protein
MERQIYIRIASALLLFLVGCVPAAYVTHPNYAHRVGQFKKVSLLPPRVDVFEIGAGGVVEKIDDWSQAGTQNVLRAFEVELASRKGIEVNVFDPRGLPDSLRSELDQTQLLFDAVVASVVPHLYGIAPQRFDDKRTNFDYSLGIDTAKLNTGDTDAFLVIKGLDHISSGGRQALQLTTMLAAAALGVVVIPQGGVTAMNVALVDARSGDIIWFISTRSEGGTDLRSPASATNFVRTSLEGFPIK